MIIQLYRDTPKSTTASFRLSTDARKILKKASDKHSRATGVPVSQGALIEALIRRLDAKDVTVVK